jgi:hypothetical protein
VGDRIVAEAALPLIQSLDGVLDELGFEQLRSQYAVAKACILTSAFAYTLQALNQRGVLPDPPPKVEPNWGFWGSEITCPLVSSP